MFSDQTAKEPPSENIIKLQHILFPNPDICGIEELYFRRNGRCYFTDNFQTVRLHARGLLSLDTYFNCFSVAKWRKYTHVSRISISLEIEGSFQISLFHIESVKNEKSNEDKTPVKQKNKTLVRETYIEQKDRASMAVFQNVPIEKYIDGQLYLSIRSSSNRSRFYGGFFYVPEKAFPLNNSLNIAVVMCTFKKEDFVRKNIDYIKSHLINDQRFQDNFTFYIIDNGKTLDTHTEDNINIIPNSNTGGAGGFSRGLLEITGSEHHYSHVIFMDDDIFFEAETFKRLFSFLLLVRDINHISIGGAMLRADKPYLQHENGAVLTYKGMSPLKTELDLRKVDNILINEIEENVDYYAWWFYCFPLVLVTDDMFPYPFFIRGDDQEYGSRFVSEKISMNSISVWHDPFKNKEYLSSTNYLRLRNELILSALIYHKYYNTFRGLSLIWANFFSLAICYRYEVLEAILQAIIDFLKGPKFIADLDFNDIIKRLPNEETKTGKDFHNYFVAEKYIDDFTFKETFIRKILRKITFNGHLLPSFLIKNPKDVNDKYFKILALHLPDVHPAHVFRLKKMFFCDPQINTGILCEYSQLKFFSKLFRLIRLSIVFIFKYSRMKTEYRKHRSEMTTRQFWEKRLGVKHSA